MRLGGRLAAAIEILEDIERRHRPAADALRDWGLSHRFAGAGDRAAIGNIVYDALRRKRTAAWMLDGDDARAVAFGALLLDGGASLESLDAALDGDRFAPPLLTASERAALADRPPDRAPPVIRADCPDWVVPMLERAFGESWVDEAAALAQRPPLDLRCNRLKSDRATVLAELSGTGAAPSDLSPDGIRIPPILKAGRHPNVQAEPSFRKGWFEVQDEGSQVAALLTGAQAGMQVLDFCAGAGGKTLALSAMMDNRGQIFAHEPEKPRLAPIFDRLARAGCRNVQAEPDATRLEPLTGAIDITIVDAPCTGSGTWRRRPDAKWRLGERQLTQRMGEQDAILSAASRFVKPSGLLVYVTCSVFCEENEDRIAHFLSGHEGWSVLDMRARWSELIGAEPSMAVFNPSGLRLSPARSGTDGFFVSVLARNG